MCSFPESECSKASIQTSWSMCIDIFNHYKLQVPSVSHAVQVLEALRQGVAFADSDGKYLLRLYAVCLLALGTTIASTEKTSTELRDSAGTPAPNMGSNMMPPHDFAQENNFNMDWLNDSWFAEQMTDLNWLENLEG